MTAGQVAAAAGKAPAEQPQEEKRKKVEFKDEEEKLPVSPEHNRNFIDCVRTRAETMCPVEMAIRCDAICHLTRAAALTGKAVEWDPVNEKVTNNPEAARMLEPQPHRDKWKIW